MDNPPDILLPDVELGVPLALVFQGDVETLTVVAQDPEEGPLVFVWQVPRGADFVVTEFEESAGISVSNAEVPQDDKLDGEEIVCNVFDAGGNSATIVWGVTVP